MLRRLLTLVALAVVFSGSASQARGVDVSSLRDLPVLDSGRVKPLDTLARDTVRFITGKESFGSIAEEPDGSQKVTDPLEPLSLLLRWAQPSRESETSPLLYVPHLDLRAKLGMKSSQKWLAPASLRGHEQFWQDFRAIDQRVRDAEREQELVALTPLEEAIRELKLRLDFYDAAADLSLYAVVPSPNANDRWVPLSRFLDGSVTDPAAAGIRPAWEQLVAGFHAGDRSAFDAGVVGLKRAIVSLAGPGYADAGALRREVFYNRLHPFRLAWIAYFASLAALVLAVLVKRPTTYWVAMALFLGAIAVNLFGFLLRCRITGWAPVTNMYESVVWVALTSALIAAVLELVYRRRTIAIGGAVAATLACVVADIMPATMGRQITPLTAVLRSNLWLTVHVLTIVSSYAAFALAFVLGNIVLFQFVRNRAASSASRAQNLNFTYRSIQIGVLLVAAGTILGGLWADVSWGRFWGWDPKEVWALIVLLVYLALLHGRYAGWIGPFGLAAGAVLCFTAVIMSWYGVNFVLGTGLHSYGFGAGGQRYVFPAVFLQWLYVAGASFVYKRRSSGVVGGAAGRVGASNEPVPTAVVGE